MAIPQVACPSPNFDERGSDTPVDILLMHYTGMETGAAALSRLCDADARVSAHYTVDEDGTIYAHVPEDKRAWHAGKSYWAGATDINARSIGIEIVNPGHEFGYRAFPDRQIEAVMELSQNIIARHSIPKERVLGHSDVAPARKQDPGELFPWSTLAAAGIGLWPQSPTPVRQSRASARSANRPSPQGGGDVHTNSPPLGGEVDPPKAVRVGGDFEMMLRRFGYGIRPDVDVSLDDVITAFQRHFRPSLVNGIADAECETILVGLLVMVPEK